MNRRIPLIAALAVAAFVVIFYSLRTKPDSAAAGDLVILEPVAAPAPRAAKKAVKAEKLSREQAAARSRKPPVRNSQPTATLSRCTSPTGSPPTRC
jgi:hypothetical protein